MKLRSLSRIGLPAVFFVSVAAASLGCHRAESTEAPAAAEPGAAPVVAVDAAAAGATAEDAVRSIPPPPDVAAPPAGATKLPSGLATIVLTRGTGKVHPTENDLVHLVFTTWTPDGKTFSASDADPNSPWMGRIYDQVDGLAEGLELMVAGEKRRLWIPSALARYPGIPAQDLVMDVELVAIVPTPKAPPTPEDAAGPPASARTTSSGLRWRLVTSGAKNAPKVDLNSIAVYNFTTWTRKGELLKSTFPEGAPKSERVVDMPPPWAEAIQLMKVGDTLRMWFTHNQGGPAGDTYVADIELLYVYALPHDGHKGDAHH